MRRNLLNRVETIFPVLDANIRHRLTRMLRTQLLDNMGAWEMLPDATYRRVQPKEGERRISSQQVFMQDSFGLPESELPDL
jgi:polyphosphate kinase